MRKVDILQNGICLSLFTLIKKINKTKNEKNVTITYTIPTKSNNFALSESLRHLIARCKNAITKG